MRRLACVAIIVVLGFFALGVANSERTAVSPDLSAIQSQASVLVAERWRQWCARFEMGGRVPVLPEVEIQMVRRVDSLLTDVPLGVAWVNPLKDTPVYLVHAVAQSGFWQTTTEHILLLQKADSHWRALFHFQGGSYGKGIDFEIVRLGTSSCREALQILDYACGNTTSQTRMHLYVHDRLSGRFVEVFNELTTWLPSVVPVVYRSTVTFENSDRALVDVVVQTEFLIQQPTESEAPTPRRSVFRWNGKRYTGKMDLPAAVEEAVSQSLRLDGLTESPEGVPSATQDP